MNQSKEAYKQRHSQYNITAEWVAPKEQVVELLGDVLHHVPTHMNAQTVRMVLLTGEAHRKHWELIEQILINQIGEERYNDGTKEKIHNSFMSGIGTVVYFNDTRTTKQLQEKFPAYAHNFEKWAREVQGSHQFAVWTGLTRLGFGASLQHYIGMADDKVREQLGVPAEWEFIAHMPFGKVVEPAQAQDKLPLSQLLIVKE